MSACQHQEWDNVTLICKGCLMPLPLGYTGKVDSILVVEQISPVAYVPVVEE